MNKIYDNLKIPFLSILTLFIFAVVAIPQAEAGIGIWGGPYDTAGTGAANIVPEGYGLTGIGYGSDDHECVLGIRTAPVDSSGTVDFTQQDGFWRTINCAGGPPGSSREANQKYYIASGQIINGWTWGANTSGGSPDDDSSPADECVFQEYAPLNDIDNRLGWGAPKDGSCNDRGYLDGSWLKQTIFAPPGRVIVGILFNLDDDARLDGLWWSTADPVLPPEPTLSVYVDAPGNQTADFTYDQSTGVFTPASKNVTIANTGIAGTSLDWNVGADESWLDASGMGGAGLISGDISLRAIAFDTSVLDTLSDGIYLGILTFTAEANGSPQNIAVTVDVSSGPGIPVPTVSIEVDGSGDPITIEYDTPVDITWTSTDADSCSATGGSAGWPGAKATSGVESTGNLTASVTYIITCTNTTGSNTDSVTVNVEPPPLAEPPPDPPFPPGSISLSLTADPTAIIRGNSTTLEWDIGSNTNWPCEVGAIGIAPLFTTLYVVPESPVGSGSASGSGVQSPLSDTTYQVRCWTSPMMTGHYVNNATVWVHPPAPTVDMMANGLDAPPPIPYNTSVDLSWTSTDATSCSASGGTPSWPGAKGTVDNETTDNLTSSATYIITCTNATGSASDSVTVNVSPEPVAFSYDLTSSDASNIVKGDADKFINNTITKTLLSGTTEPVTLSVAGLPADTSAAIADISCSPTCTSVITITVGPTAPVGSHLITVTGTSESAPDEVVTFWLNISGNPISVSCLAIPSVASIGETVTWVGSPVGGVLPYTFSWSGTNIPTAPAPDTSSFDIIYSTVGLKSAVLTVTDSDVPANVASCPAATAFINFDPRFEEF